MARYKGKDISDIVINNPSNYLRFDRPEIISQNYGFDMEYRFFLLDEKRQHFTGKTKLQIYKKNRSVLWGDFYPLGPKLISGKENPLLNKGGGIRAQNIIIKGLENEIGDPIDRFNMLHYLGKTEDPYIEIERINHLSRMGIDTTQKIVKLHGTHYLVFGEPFPSYSEKSRNYERDCKEKQRIEKEFKENRLNIIRQSAQIITKPHTNYKY